MIQLKNVSGKDFRYNDLLARENETFSISDEELDGLMGEIGAGHVMIIKLNDIKFKKNKRIEE